MAHSIPINAELTLARLTAKLREIETTVGAVTGLSHEDGARRCTLAMVEPGRFAPSGLKIVLDPTGDAAPPPDRRLVCRGIVYIGGELHQVAAFRAAAGSPGQLSVGRSAGAVAVGPLVAGAAGVIGSGAVAAALAHATRQRGPAAAASAGTKVERMLGRTSAAAKEDSSLLSAPMVPRGPSVPKTPPSVDVARALAALDPCEYRVWFGTNRKPVDPARIARGFSAERDSKVHYGHCDVYVPLSHKFGSIGSNALIRWYNGKDDRLKLRRLAELERKDFWAGIGRQIGSAAPGARHAVVFIHGYRVSFRDAALRTAQIGTDLGIEGAMAFFSWPSKGTLLGYLADGNAIEGSEAAIADFLVDFTRRSGAEAVHVIAHSMGNRGLLRAANRIVAAAVRRGGGRFGQIILAAPDVDADNFRDLAAAYRKLAKRTTLYISSKDLAVQLARWISDYARVGFHPPVTVVDGIDTVSVTNLDLTLLGHGYVAEAREVLHDMQTLITDNKAPPRCGQKEKRTPEGRRYWEVRA